MKKRTLIILLATFGVAVGLIGWGVSAALTDSATATQTVKIGNLAIEITSTNPDAVIVNNGGVHTVTLASPDLMSSAAGTAPLPFTVKSLGSIGAIIHVVVTPPVAPFLSLLSPPADVTLNQNESHDYAGGLQWPMLGNADMGKSTSVVYTITATEASAGPVLPPIPTFTRVGNVLTIRVHLVDGTTILPGDTLSTYNFGAVVGHPAWVDGLATADANGVIYYVGDGFSKTPACVEGPGGPPLYLYNYCPTQASAGNYQITIKRGGSIMKSFAAHL